jgi:hypothetical protein
LSTIDDMKANIEMNFELFGRFFQFFPPGSRVGSVDGLANRFPGGPQNNRFALLSAAPGGVIVHTRHFNLPTSPTKISGQIT